MDLSVSTSNLSLQMFVGNDLYFFLRLYRMFYARLRKAKELCRNASAKKIAGETLSRPKQIPKHLAQVSKRLLRSPRLLVGSAMDVEGSPTRRVSSPLLFPLLQISRTIRTRSACNCTAGHYITISRCLRAIFGRFNGGRNLKIDAEI